MPKNIITLNVHLNDPDPISVSSMLVHHSGSRNVNYVTAYLGDCTIIATEEAAQALCDKLGAHLAERRATAEAMTREVLTQVALPKVEAA